MAKSYTTFVALLFCFLLIAATEVEVGEAKVCQKRSKTWTGPCIVTGNCSRQCKNIEGATFGACHRSGFGFACFCYFKC